MFQEKIFFWNEISIKIRELPTFHQVRRQLEVYFFEVKTTTGMTPWNIGNICFLFNYSFIIPTIVILGIFYHYIYLQLRGISL